MSDYFARLVARERGELPVLQPRVASRFESEPTLVQEGGATEPPAIRATPRAHVGAEVEDRSTPTQRHSQAPTSNVVQPTVVRPASPPMVPTSPLSRERSERVTERERIDASLPVRTPAERELRPALAPIVARGEARPSQAIAERAATPPADASSAPSSASPSPVAALAPTAAPALRPTRAAAAAARAPEPVIHVSIGRIEVRAAAAPAPSARRTASTANSGLDAYLRDRRRT